MTNDQVVYDYKVVDDIRAKEAELEAAIESARRSINLLKSQRHQVTQHTSSVRNV
jgi:hypothetical protein